VSTLQRPDLPHTWRPFGTRLVGGAAMFALIATCVGTWFAFPPDIRAKFTPFQIGTILVLCAMAFTVWLALVRSRVTATEQGLTVVNGFKTREYEWAQLITASLRRGAPWASLDLSDGDTVPMMGIQSSDGDRAQTAVRVVRAFIREHSAEGGESGHQP
jgi:hypothetical protein